MWLAALKPTTIGVPAYRDDVREYLEIAVAHADCCEPSAKAARLVELIHRAVPYPVLLVVTEHGGATVSLAHKRWSQGEAGKTVLDGEVVAADPVAGRAPTPASLPSSTRSPSTSQPRGDLCALYQGWMDTSAGAPGRPRHRRLRAAGLAEQADARREALADVRPARRRDRPPARRRRQGEADGAPGGIELRTQAPGGRSAPPRSTNCEDDRHR